MDSLSSSVGLLEKARTRVCPYYLPSHRCGAHACTLFPVVPPLLVTYLFIKPRMQAQVLCVSAIATPLSLCAPPERLHYRRFLRTQLLLILYTDSLAQFSFFIYILDFYFSVVHHPPFTSSVKENVKN